MVDSIGAVVLAASGGDPVADDAKATVKAGIITQKSPSERLIGQPDGPTKRKSVDAIEHSSGEGCDAAQRCGRRTGGSSVDADGVRQLG
jgi:hypothetical protein